MSLNETKFAHGVTYAKVKVGPKTPYKNETAKEKFLIQNLLVMLQCHLSMMRKFLLDWVSISG